MGSDTTLNVYIPKTEDRDNLESELRSEPIDASADFVQQEQVSKDSVVEPYHGFIEDIGTSEESESRTGQLTLADFLDSENDSDKVERIVSNMAPPPEIAIEAVSLGVTITQDVGAGVLAGLLCEKLRERGVSTILLPQGSDDTNEVDESKEVDVDEEALKSVIDERLGGIDDDQDE